MGWVTLTDVKVTFVSLGLDLAVIYIVCVHSDGMTNSSCCVCVYMCVQGVCHIDSDVMTIIVLLTQAGANLDLSVCEYSNPLVTASFLQALPLVRFFLDQGAEPNIACKLTHGGGSVGRASDSRSKEKHKNCRFGSGPLMKRKKTDVSELSSFFNVKSK